MPQPPQHPSSVPVETPRRDGRNAETPFCDEFSGGGGSATDTRDRGMPGGSRREGDCTPIGRGDGTEQPQPAPAPTPGTAG